MNEITSADAENQRISTIYHCNIRMRIKQCRNGSRSRKNQYIMEENIMSKRVFLYKDNSESRDCCAYIEPSRFECGHYFSGLTLHGARYSGRDMAAYEDIKTVLTETEYNKLVEFSKAISVLGFGITKGDERYQQGIKLCEDIQPIFDKLESEEAEEFFETIQEEEKEYLKEEYSLDDEDIQQIFDEYYLEYRDRAIVGYVFNDAYDCGYEEAFNCGYVNNNDSIMKKYFDFEKFGQDLADDDENYLELSDGRIVHFVIEKE